jgi:large subunit ribosomal protein L44e
MEYDRRAHYPSSLPFFSNSHANPYQVNVPKTRKTFCKGQKCRKHTLHKVSQYKQGKASLFAQGKRRYDRKQSGYGGQTKPVFRKKAKTTKKIALRLECTQCKYKHQIALKRCKHFELGGDKKTKVCELWWTLMSVGCRFGVLIAMSNIHVWMLHQACNQLVYLFAWPDDGAGSCVVLDHVAEAFLGTGRMEVGCEAVEDVDPVLTTDACWMVRTVLNAVGTRLLRHNVEGHTCLGGRGQVDGVGWDAEPPCEANPRLSLRGIKVAPVHNHGVSLFEGLFTGTHARVTRYQLVLIDAHESLPKHDAYNTAVPNDAAVP